MRRLPARLAAIWVAAAVLLLLADGCGPAPSPSLIRTGHLTSIVGTTWELVALGGRTLPVGTTVTLTFGPSDVSGKSSCTSFGGTYAYDTTSGALRIDGLTETKRACLDAGFNGVENAFFDALRGVASTSVDPDGRLVLGGSGAELVFEVGPVLVPAVTTAPSGAPSGPASGAP